jgi:hypothetical protein
VEGIAIFIGVCIVAAIVLAVAVFVGSARVRSALLNWAKPAIARDVYRTAYEFTTSISARRVIDAIGQRWGRTVPTGEAGFYIRSVIEQQQVILVFGNQIKPRIFAARIDFESRDPASGSLWFFDAEDLSDGTEAADKLRSDFACLIAELSPGAVLQESHEDKDILTYRPEGPIRSHRRRRR